MQKALAQSGLRLLAAAALLLCQAALASQHIRYTQPFSALPAQHFPGGRYKASHLGNFPGSTAMSGALIVLEAGGLREQHWHNPNEWAAVLNGTCRATMLDQGRGRPSESWDFQPGDIWYFPSNAAHSILGLEPTGCTYIAGYDEATFEERNNSRGVSLWLSSNPPDILAQAMGMELADIKAMVKGPHNGFISKGDIKELTEGQGEPPLLAAKAAPLQPPKATTQFHRLAVDAMIAPEVKTAGGTIKNADVMSMPSSTKMSGALVRMEPGALRQLHWHLAMDEWQYLHNGSMELGIFNESGFVTRDYLGPGDVGFAPRGMGHYLKNTADHTAFLVLIFNDGLFTNIDATNLVGAFPLPYAASALGQRTDAMEQWDLTGAGIVPAHQPDKKLPKNLAQRQGRPVGAQGAAASAA